MDSHLSVKTVDNAIKLLDAAKRMGVQSFKLGTFHVAFENLDAPPNAAGPSDTSSLLNDRDLWGHVAPRG